MKRISVKTNKLGQKKPAELDSHMQPALIPYKAFFLKEIRQLKKLADL